MHKIALLRQGQSTWNQENRFTDRAGWTDAGLVEKGLAEAFAAGQLLKKEGFAVGIAHTPVQRSWRLKERHYADLPAVQFPRTECLKDTVERET
jgi:2,3-bisphosphoglycerate-dependent phosphoglycerate mutase